MEPFTPVDGTLHRLEEDSSESAFMYSGSVEIVLEADSMLEAYDKAVSSLNETFSPIYEIKPLKSMVTYQGPSLDGQEHEPCGKFLVEVEGEFWSSEVLGEEFDTSQCVEEVMWFGPDCKEVRYTGVVSFVVEARNHNEAVVLAQETMDEILYSYSDGREDDLDVNEITETETDETPDGVYQQEGRKFDAGKNRLDLIPGEVLDALGKVLTHGASKYGAQNWKKVERDRYEAALLRHYVAQKQGQKIDTDSGFPHTSMMLANAAFLAWFDLQETE